MRARIDIALGVVLVALVVVGALRWADTTWRPVIVLQSVGPFVVIGLSLLVIATLLARRWWMLVPVGVCAAIAWALALPGFFASTVEAPVELTVMAANLDVGQANADQVIPKVERAIEDAVAGGMRDDYQLQQVVRRTIGSWAGGKIRRRPMIIPVVLQA
jgi:hypothetical protein